MTQYAYDDENNLSSITDANTHATTFLYDNLGRVKETDFPSGRAETYIYDVIGNLTSKTDRNGNTITYVYDALNRLTHKGYSDSGHFSLAAAGSVLVRGSEWATRNLEGWLGSSRTCTSRLNAQPAHYAYYELGNKIVSRESTRNAYLNPCLGLRW